MNYLLIFVWIWLLHFLAPKDLEPKIFFSEKIDSSGNFPHYQKDFLIDPIQGSSIFLIYQTKRAIPKPKIYIFIDKKGQNNQYKEFDSQRLAVLTDTMTLLYTPYLFTQEGNYAITFADAEKKEIITDFLNIRFKNNLIFCETIDANDVPVNHQTVFKLPQKNVLSIYTFLKMSVPIGYTNIVHEVYRFSGKNYDELVIAEKFSINPSWEYTYLKAQYTQIGKYRAKIKTDNNKTLGMNDFEIK